MSVFSTILARQLKELSKGKTLQIRTTDSDRYNIVVKGTEKYKNAVQQNFTFWIDNETGELCCNFFRFLGESPNEYDQESSYVHKGQTALALLYKYGFLDRATVTETYLPGKRPNEQVMSLGLSYIIEIMKIVDSKVPREPNPTKGDGYILSSKRDVSKLLLNGYYISFEDFTESFNKTPLNLKDVIEELDKIANNTMVRPRIHGMPDHPHSTDEELYGPKHDEKRNEEFDIIK